MPTFDSATRSQALNRPIILYTITSAGVPYNLTTNGTDVVFGGDTYTAITVAHEDEDLTQDASGNELVIHLPITHPIVQRYAATGIPDQGVRVTIRELQSTASDAALAWSGVAQSLSVGLNVADIRVPTVTADALRIQLPVIAAHPTCNHILFDINCAPNPGGDWPDFSPGSGNGGPVRSSFQFGATIDTISPDGKTFLMITGPSFTDGFFTFGKMFANIVAADLSSERQTRSVVAHQFFTVPPRQQIEIDVPFVASADQLRATIWTLEAGCSHDPTTCVNKFANIANFGGHPTMNNQHNIWGPAGLGVIQQV